ncbi:MAG TPA: hypothetical protein VGY58_22830 [Gemmataceae bacterium]|jgi:hypothetical protein|nr:hypothetical protein [Gemmataceae bacterium]
MFTGNVLEQEEYIEQAYFFRVFRERVATNMAAQEILERIHEEILSTTRLPLAIQFLATELKHSGLLSSGFSKLPHYFTPYQAFVIRQTEEEGLRFSIDTALLILERQAGYLAGQPTQPGLFVFQFEVLSRNRLGYDEGLASMMSDPFYDAAWQEHLGVVRLQVGVVDFADLVYLRSEFYLTEQRRHSPQYQLPVPALFGEKEGKIARANRGRDPLYLFAALQRQLGYPEVPRPKPRDDLAARFEALAAKTRELEIRLKLLESETRGQVDLSEFGKPEILRDDDDT